MLRVCVSVVNQSARWDRRNDGLTLDGHSRHSTVLPIVECDDQFVWWQIQQHLNQWNIVATALKIVVIDNAMLMIHADTHKSSSLVFFGSRWTTSSFPQPDLSTTEPLQDYRRLIEPPTLWRFSLRWYQSKISRRSEAVTIWLMIFHTPSCPSPKQVTGWEDGLFIDPLN